MHHINNKILATFAILLMLISITGQVIIFKRADEIEQSPLEKVTGKASGTVFIAIMRPFTEMNLRGELEDDNETVRLIWNDLGHDNISIFIAKNATGFNFGAPNITGITVFNWSDPTSGNDAERYYKIGMWNMGLFNVSENTVVKYDMNLTTTNGRWNYLSLPAEPMNNSRNEVLKGISGSYDWIYEYNPTGGNYSYWFDPFSTGNIHNLTPDKCYIIKMTDNITFTIVGNDNTDINENLVVDNGRWNYLGWVNEITPRNAATGTIAGDFDWIYEYVALSGNYSFWFDPFTTGNIDYFNPGRCYIIQATVNNTVLNYAK